MLTLESSCQVLCRYCLRCSTIRKLRVNVSGNYFLSQTVSCARAAVGESGEIFESCSNNCLDIVFVQKTRLCGSIFESFRVELIILFSKTGCHVNVLPKSSEEGTASVFGPECQIVFKGPFVRDKGSYELAHCFVSFGVAV